MKGCGDSVSFYSGIAPHTFDFHGSWRMLAQCQTQDEIVLWLHRSKTDLLRTCVWKRDNLSKSRLLALLPGFRKISSS